MIIENKKVVSFHYTLTNETGEELESSRGRDPMAYLHGAPAGYVELEKGAAGDVHIWCFGLLPAFIGQGLGGHLLTVAVEHAWAPAEANQGVGGGMGATKVWLRTCSHDHPHALENYLARGFQIVTQEQTPANPAQRSFWELVGL